MSAPRRAQIATLLIGALVGVGCGKGTDVASPPLRDPATSIAPTAPSTAPSTAPTGAPGSAPAAVRRLRAEIVATLPHDPTWFTQGLEVDGAIRYESSGLYGASVVRSIDLASGAVTRSFTLPPTYFAEGLSRVGDRLYVLTWREQTVFVLDAATLEERGRLTYTGEGWGICALGDDLVTSDGSATLSFRDPATFSVRRTIMVSLDAQPVRSLNELECVDGAVYANVWKSTTIMRVDPATGTVTATTDLASLVPSSTTADPDAVLNGIAFDRVTGRFLVTGKRWPVLYDVRLVDT